MPYPANEDLPVSVQRALPPHAQDIYRAAFNNAWQARRLDIAADEVTAHRIAWSAVKRRYVKCDGRWIPKPLPSGGGSLIANEVMDG